MKAKSTFCLLLFVLTLWTCTFAVNAQVEYQPEMEKNLGDWDCRVNHSRHDYLKIFRKGDYVYLGYKQEFSNVLDGTPTSYNDAGNLSFSNDTFFWSEVYYPDGTYNLHAWKLNFERGLLKLVYSVSLGEKQWPAVILMFKPTAVGF